MKFTLWGQEIEYQEKLLAITEFIDFLKADGEKTIAKLLAFGEKKEMGWAKAAWEFLPNEMPKICNRASNYAIKNGILERKPNWSLFLPERISIAEKGAKIFQDYMNNAYNVAAVQARNQYDNAFNNAMANSEGLGFGIISNSLSAHLLYAAQSARKEKENEKKAHELAEQAWRMNDPFKRGEAITIEYYFSNFEPFLIKILSMFYDEVQDIVVKGSDVDISSLNANVEDIVLSPKSDREAMKTDVVNAFNSNICNPNTILFVIQNNLIDDDFVLFFAQAPEKLIKISAQAITEHLLKKKKECSLYNKEFLSEETIKFFAMLQALFKNQTVTPPHREAYFKIVDDVYGKEIKSIIRKFDNLTKIKKSNYELQKYAQNYSSLNITKNDIDKLIFYHNIFDDSQTSLFILNSGVVVNFDITTIEAVVEETNAKLKVEHENYLKQEEERKQRELEHQRELETRRRTLKTEISELNTELESLGLAWFGKKAQRKAELKSLIETKTRELNNLK